MKTFIFVVLLISSACAWDSEQLEVFDVVEEVKENFYEMLNITKDAETSKIRSAFRRLSVLWHPDKNLNEDTSEKFRNLVSVYEVLKDLKKRAYYDEVLVNGLPNWKSAMYYYRRVRKMGIIEGYLIVLFLCTIIQYICAWASYFEKKYTQEQLLKKKKTKKNQTPQLDPSEEILKPSMLNTLPIQIPKVIYKMIISLPELVILLKTVMAEKMAKEDIVESEDEHVQESKPKRKKQGFIIPEGPNFEIKKTRASVNKESATAAPVSGGFWSDDDLAELIQLVKKYPGGTPKRWEVIAESINRTVAEVTFMANRMKTNGYRLPNTAEEAEIEEKVKQKTKGGKLGGAVDEAVWSQHEQKMLEDALAKYPKRVTDRWDRVAEMVPTKTKEECILRFKFLVESIKKQKEQ